MVVNKTRRALVKFLKTEGAMDATQLGEKLGLTAMAVRQHLYALQHEKLVASDERHVPFGRPAKYWRLTPAADRLFPDAYAELSVALIGALGDAFGEAGLTRILESRSATKCKEYRKQIPPSLPLKEKLQKLASIRTEEGYMAEVKPAGRNVYLFVENHCPICAAATACMGFCSTELDLFRAVLGPDAAVERAEHILGGDRRCAYRVTAKH